MANYTCYICGKPCGTDYRVVGYVVDGWPHELPRNVAVHRACAPQLSNTEFGRHLAAAPVRPAPH